MNQPTEARLIEIATLLGNLREEICGWDNRDFEWLITRLRDAQTEAKFINHMIFSPKPGKAGLLPSKSQQNPT